MPSAASSQPSVSKPTGGVLPISAITSQQASGADNKAHAKGPSQRLKVVIRRLPPGLTRSEFDEALGEEWKTGQGKISWTLYKSGKISKDLSKPSRPARAYFQVTQQSHLETFAEKVRQTSFLDARNTANDASLLGPPILEFAPYSRVPSGKKRNDVRQGLIDQDPEFIAFLESLTNPTPKAPAVDGLESGQQKEDPVKVTPLIQHLRDKKAAKEAAKEKEKAAAKSGKHNRQISKSETANSASNGKSSKENVKSSVEPSEKKGTRAAKQEKVTKQTTKQAKKEQPATEPKSSAPKPSAPAEAAKTTESPSKRPEKPSPATAAARMIQRDLGIRGRGLSRGRGGRQATETSQAAISSNENEQPSPQPNGKATTSPSSKQPKSAATEAPSTPAILKREAPPEKPATSEPAPKPNSKAKSAANQSGAASATAAVNSPSTTAPAPKPKPTKPPPTISPNATHAFLKHANPSQGITEPLIMAALSVFGEVSHVEIDKRKGFAYVDFVDSESLQKAINASPVKVAQGSVQVLERKERPPAAARGGGGSSGSSAGAQGRGASIASATPGSTPPVGPRNPATSGSAVVGFRGGRGRGRGGSTRGSASTAPGPAAGIGASATLTPSVAPADAEAKSAVPAEIQDTNPSVPLDATATPEPAEKASDAIEAAPAPSSSATSAPEPAASTTETPTDGA